MAVLTGPRNTVLTRTRLGDTLRVPMAADAICFLGGLACADANGYAVAAADTADYKLLGVVVEDPQDPTATASAGKYDNTDGSDGDVEVVVRWAGRARLDYAAPVTGEALQQDMLGAECYVQDDQTVSVHPWDSLNDVRCGHVIRLPGTTLSAHAETQMGAGEVEIEFSGEPFEWMATDVTTTTAGA